MALAVWRGKSRASVSIQQNSLRHWVWRDHGVPRGWLHSGGTWIDLVMTVRNCTYAEAVRELRDLLYSLPQTQFSLPHPHKANADRRETKILRVSRVTNAALEKYLHARGTPVGDLPEWLKEVHYVMDGKVYYSLGVRTVKGSWQI